MNTLKRMTLMIGATLGPVALALILAPNNPALMMLGSFVGVMFLPVAASLADALWEV